MRPPSTTMAAADLKHLNFSGLGHAASGHGSVFDRQSGHSVSNPHHTGHLHSVGNPHHYHSNHHHSSHSTALNHSFSQVNSTESVFHYKCVVVIILTSVICLLTASVLNCLEVLEFTFMKLSSSFSHVRPRNC